LVTKYANIINKFTEPFIMCVDLLYFFFLDKILSIDKIDSCILLCYVAALARDFATTCYVQSFVEFATICYVAALACDFATTCYVQAFVEFATSCYVMPPRVG
jgi:hypothetical protein